MRLRLSGRCCVLAVSATFLRGSADAAVAAATDGEPSRSYVKDGDKFRDGD